MFSVLVPHLHAVFIVPVLLYCFTIASMVYRGLARSARVCSLPSVQLSAVGCLFFLLSDSTLAINMFMSSFKASDQLVMSTYYIAQVCMGLSAASFIRTRASCSPRTGMIAAFFSPPPQVPAVQPDDAVGDGEHLLGP
jgi:hypothetical protein